MMLFPSNATYLVAEMSANHHQDYYRAVEIIDVAAAAGADAIKLQTYTADTLTINCSNEYFQIKNHPLWEGRNLYEFYQSTYTPWDWHAPLKQHAESLGLDFFSSPFDITAIDFLETLGVDRYKIASFLTEHHLFLESIGKTGKPVILSRGLTSFSQLENCIDILVKAGCPEVAILHCISGYPTPPDQMNLKSIQALQERFGTIVGLSDHCLSNAPAIASVALGARIIEKHLTLSRKNDTADAAFSLEPHEFKQLVDSVRTVETALGTGGDFISKIEDTSLQFKPSIFITKDIKTGEILSEENIRIIRPAFGLSPIHYIEVVGKAVNQNLSRGTPLSWKHIT